MTYPNDPFGQNPQDNPAGHPHDPTAKYPPTAGYGPLGDQAPYDPRSYAQPGYGQSPYAPEPPRPRRKTGLIAAIAAAVVVVVAIAVGAFFLLRNDDSGSDSQASPGSDESTTSAGRTGTSKRDSGDSAQDVADDLNTHLKSQALSVKSFEDVNDLVCAEYGLTPEKARKVDAIMRSAGEDVEKLFGDEMGTDLGDDVSAADIRVVDGSNAVVTNEKGEKMNLRKERGHWRFCDPEMSLKELDTMLEGLEDLEAGTN